MDKQMESAQLLARFKLQVKRSLNRSVDLERLVREPSYARHALAEIENLAEEEGLLVMVIRLRDLLLPEIIQPPSPVEDAPKKTLETRNYLRGARSW